MKKIKVLHISETFAAGVYTYIRDFCHFCENHSYIKSYVIYSPKREDTNIAAIRKEFSEKVDLIEIPMEREISPFRDLKALCLIVKELKRINPDVIHLHSSKAGVIGRIGSLFVSNTKVFYTPHGYAFLKEDISDRKKRIYRFIEKFTQKSFGGITIACGDTEYDLAQKIGKSVLVRNGLNPNKIPENQYQENEVFTITTVGRITTQKNPDLFVDIASKLPNFKFKWIGDGELANRLNKDNITKTGWLTREKVFQELGSTDVYIQTSKWEGLPFTLIEAMALKKPIIASNIPGNKDVIVSGQNGFLFNDADEAAKYLKALKEDHHLRLKMSKNSYLHFQKYFNSDENYKKLINIYQGY